MYQIALKPRRVLARAPDGAGEKSVREKRGVRKKKREARRGEEKRRGGPCEAREPDAEDEREPGEGKERRSAHREDRGKGGERKRGGEIRRVAAQRADDRGSAGRGRVRRFGRNAQCETRRGERGKEPREARGGGERIRNGEEAEAEGEKGGQKGGGQTPPPGFAGSPLKEGAGFPRLLPPGGWLGNGEEETGKKSGGETPPPGSAGSPLKEGAAQRPQNTLSGNRTGDEKREARGETR